jgi:hypothetical protein
VNDPYCRETLGIVGDYAAQMFSDRKHLKWDRAELPGAEFLRLQIMHALDSLHSRLFSLEVIRRAGAYVATSGYEDDLLRINVAQDYELAYWSSKFGVSRDRLRQAVAQAGPMVKNVERHLRTDLRGTL